MNIGPISDAINAMAGLSDSLRAVVERNAQDGINLQATQDRKAASDQEIITVKASLIAAVDQFGALATQFVADTKAALA